jgi:hypothetical protein
MKSLPGSIPDALYAVSVENNVRTDYWHAFHKRRQNQKAVEGILVVVGQCRLAIGMIQCYGQQRQTQLSVRAVSIHLRKLDSGSRLRQP